MMLIHIQYVISVLKQRNKHYDFLRASGRRLQGDHWLLIATQLL